MAAVRLWRAEWDLSQNQSGGITRTTSLPLECSKRLWQMDKTPRLTAIQSQKITQQLNQQLTSLFK
jgi:hypothetical protein